MIISKYIHSCLLIKDQGKTILIDPGSYSVEGKAITTDMINQLDYLLVTHEHFDHLHIPFVKELVAKFPDLTIISNEAVSKILLGENIKVQLEGNELIEIVNAPHEHIFGTVQRFKNSLFNVFSNLTHPGDNISFDKTSRILALPIQAPWVSLTQAVEKAVALKPEVVIPIHDWHWNEDAREAFYSRLKDYFAQSNIKFIGLQTGEEIEL